MKENTPKIANRFSDTYSNHAKLFKNERNPSYIFASGLMLGEQGFFHEAAKAFLLYITLLPIETKGYTYLIFALEEAEMWEASPVAHRLLNRLVSLHVKSIGSSDNTQMTEDVMKIARLIYGDSEPLPGHIEMNRFQKLINSIKFRLNGYSRVPLCRFLAKSS